MLPLLKKFVKKHYKYFWEDYFQHPFFVTIFLLIGILTYFSFYDEPDLNVISWNFCFAIFSFFSLKKYLIKKFNNHYALVLYFFAIYLSFSTGLFVAKLDGESHKKPLIEKKYFLSDASGHVKNIISYEFKTCFIISEFSSKNLEFQKLIKKNSLLRLCSNNINFQDIEIGDDIFLKKISIKPLPFPVFPGDYQFARSAYFDNIIGLGYFVDMEKNFFKNNISILDKINRLRQKFSKEIISDLGEKAGGIVAAMTLGNRDFLDEDIKNNMRNSSIFHLIAISGLHISLFSVFFIYFWGRLSAFFFDRHINYYLLKKITLGMALIAILIYLAFSGFTLSAQRAFFMATIVNLAIFRGKQIINRKVINWAILIILIFEPHSILNPGLQMSILAVLSLICFDIKSYIYDLKNFLGYKKDDFSDLDYSEIAGRRNVPRGTFFSYFSSKISNICCYKDDVCFKNEVDNLNCSTWNNLNSISKPKNIKNYSIENIKIMKCSTWNISNSQKLDSEFITKTKNVPRGTFLISKSSEEENCSTWNNFKCIKLQKINRNIQYLVFFKTIIKNICFFCRFIIYKIVPRGTILFFETLVPHLSILPVMLYYFNGFSTYTIVANLIAIPVTSFFIMPLNIIYFIAKMFHVEHLKKCIVFLLKYSVLCLLKISEIFGNLKFGYFRTFQISKFTFLFMIVGVLWILIWKKIWRFYGIIFYIIGIFLLFKNSLPDIMICKNKNNIDIIVKENNLLHSTIIHSNNFCAKKFLMKSNQEEFASLDSLKLFHVEQFNNQKKCKIENNNSNCSTWNNLNSTSKPKNIKNYSIENIKIMKCSMWNISNSEKLDSEFITKTKNVPHGTFLISKSDEEENCSTWNNFEINRKNLTDGETKSIFFLKSNLKIFNSFDYLGNRLWNFQKNKNE